MGKRVSRAGVAAMVFVVVASVVPVASAGTTAARRPPAGASAEAGRPTPPDQAATSIDAAALRNADGTLNLTSGTSGSVSFAGFDVRLDPTRGPVLSEQTAGAGSAMPPVAAADPVADAPAAGHWGALGSARGGPDSTVKAVAIMGSDVYVGGYFLSAGGVPYTRGIARWDGAAWHSVGGGLHSSVIALAVGGTTLYAGGSFTEAGGLPAADYVAAWNGSAWSSLGSDGAGNGAVTSGVTAIAVSGSTVYVGGQFTSVRQSNAPVPGTAYIARFSGGTWSALTGNGAGGSSLNAPVNAIAADSLGNVYVGGAFQNVSNGAVVLVAADYIAEWNGSGWHSMGGFAPLGQSVPTDGALTGAVNALAVDAANAVYVGGAFTDVRTLFFSDNGTDYIAKWDGAWHGLGSAPGGGGALGGPVFAVAVHGSDVYAGGSFQDASGAGGPMAAGDFVAHWNGTAWSAMGAGPSGNGSIGAFVDGLAVTAAGTVLVGGEFDQAFNGSTRLAGVSFVTWNPASKAWASPSSTAPSLSGTNGPSVLAITVRGSDVYVGGSFWVVANGDVRPARGASIAKWDGTRWTTLGTDALGRGGVSGAVRAITFDTAGNLYAGGDFTAVDNGTTTVAGAAYIARWNGSAWSAVGSSGSAEPVLNAPVSSIVVAGSTLYAGGSFHDITDAGVFLGAGDYVVAYNLATGHWAPLLGNAAGDGSVYGDVRSLAFYGSKLYVGGNFTNVRNGLQTLDNGDYLVAWDPATETWSTVGETSPTIPALNGAADALLATASGLYVGGSFTHAAGNGAASFVARWNGSTWSGLGHDGSGAGSIKYPVFALAMDGLGRLYAGGAFKDVNDGAVVLGSADYVSRWDGTHWSALGSDGAGDGALGAPVNALAVQGATLLVGGDFLAAHDGTAILPAASLVAGYGLPVTRLTYRSTGSQDGWVLESGEKTSAGGTTSASSSTLRVGDNASRRQYRSILSFSTKGLPDNAVITKVTLRVRRSGLSGGGNPVSTFGGFVAELRKGAFGTTGLAKGDFSATATRTTAPVVAPLSSGWYAVDLTSAAAAVNKLTLGSGLTQVRLRFKLDDNNNGTANYLSLYSGNASTSSRPQLVVEVLAP